MRVFRKENAAAQLFREPWQQEKGSRLGSMEPVTHLLTGACLSRAGLNRRAAHATVTMAIAAEFPDIDTLWSLRGPVAGFEHHRGITHTFVALPVEAAVVVGIVYVLHRVFRHRDAHAGASSLKSAPPAPLRWGLLYCFALLALLSHLLLDYSNNYGLRPFFPFNPRWYAGSFVFIFDPLIFLMLAMAFLLPPLFALVNSEVGARRQRFRGRGWAIASLLCIALVWGLRATEHARAVVLTSAQSVAQPVAMPQPDTGATTPDTTATPPVCATPAGPRQPRPLQPLPLARRLRLRRLLSACRGQSAQQLANSGAGHPHQTRPHSSPDRGGVQLAWPRLSGLVADAVHHRQPARRPDPPGLGHG